MKTFIYHRTIVNGGLSNTNRARWNWIRWSCLGWKLLEVIRLWSHWSQKCYMWQNKVSSENHYLRLKNVFGYVTRESVISKSGWTITNTLRARYIGLIFNIVTIWSSSTIANGCLYFLAIWILHKDTITQIIAKNGFAIFASNDKNSLYQYI